MAFTRCLEHALKPGIKTWVRDLQQNRRVITFVASKEGPSDVSQRVQQGVFAQGVRDALCARLHSPTRWKRSAGSSARKFSR